MKTFNKNDLLNYFAKSLLIATVFLIPFYQFRIDLHSFSISILTIALIFLWIALFTKNFHYIKSIFQRSSFLYFSIFFVLSFIPALLISPNAHAYGVFVEWIFFPAIIGVLLWIEVSHDHTSYKHLLHSLCTMSLLVGISALFYLFLNMTTYDGRLHAFFLSPNHLAMFLVPFPFLSLALFLQENNLFLRILAIPTVIITIIVIFFTQSLSTFFALALAGTFSLFFVDAHKHIKTLLILFLMIFAVVFCYHKLMNSDAVFERNSFSSRLIIWDVSAHLVQKNPLVGVGIDAFQDHYLSAQKYYPPYLEWAVPTAHNIALHFLTNSGFLTLLSFMILSTFVVCQGLVTYHKTKKERRILFLCIAFGAILFCGALDTPYWKNDLAIIYWIVAALIMSHAQTLTQATGQRASQQVQM